MTDKLPNPKQKNSLRRKLTRVDEVLRARFGALRQPRWRRDPLADLIGTILSQNTNDLNSARAYESLRNAFPTWELMLEATPSRIARAIRIGGLANQKSRYIKDFLKWVRKTYGRLSLDAMHGMSPAEAVDIFTRHKGIGLKTIYVTLLFACGKDVFPVDTHIYRIVRRLDIAPEKFTRDQVTNWMQPLLTKGQAYALHLHLIRFGREVCKARRPLCHDCPFTRICRYPDKQLTGPNRA